MPMDELPTSLAALVNEARSAHDPRPADARRVALALSAALPAFRPPLQGLESLAGASGGAGAGAGAVTGGAAASAVGGAAVHGTLAGLGSVGKGLAVLAVAAAVSTSVVMRATPEERVVPPARAVATEPARVAPAQPAPLPAQPAPLPAVTRALGAEPSAEPTVTVDPVTLPAPIAITRRPTAVNSRPAAPLPAPTPTPDPVPAATPPSELRLIQQAAQALRDLRPDLAHALLAEHAARFPDGALRQEREGLHVLALCQQGALEQALPLRERFLADAPSSPLAGRVRRACADAER